MIDAHCHLQEFENPAEVITGLEAVICCGAGVTSSQKAVELAQKFDNAWVTVGAHPEEIQDADENKLRELLTQPKVVAVGECGLDYYENTSPEEKNKQKVLLELNIRLAKEKNLPLVVHCRNAFADIFEELNYDKVQMHCFTGNLEQMQECLQRGWYLSFGGILTFKKSDYLREVAKQVPEDRLLIETDAPYLSPEPIRGERNTPQNVKIVAQILAALRGTSIERIEQVTTENAKRLFQI